ncbi:response regulator [Limnospira platensis]|uniref:response regulator n=1 Tax=Limnospira platensis TaxID=118562 RepID=UPI0001D0ECBD|nr:response regulator [Arthrospira sp. PCC 9108]BAI89637.1 two-component response regulator, fragment [Arthrospira platensis NIES-39]
MTRPSAGLALRSKVSGRITRWRLADWLVPELSGLELCQRIRANPHPLPILMLTALGQPDHRITGRR